MSIRVPANFAGHASTFELELDEDDDDDDDEWEEEELELLLEWLLDDDDE